MANLTRRFTLYYTISFFLPECTISMDMTIVKKYENINWKQCQL
jgi:hypothetical protein